jgi:hypothetical protein
MEIVEASSNSPHSYIFLRCFETAGTLTSKRLFFESIYKYFTTKKVSFVYKYVVKNEEK